MEYYVKRFTVNFFLLKITVIFALTLVRKIVFDKSRQPFQLYDTNGS
jgi:hypothetical protein